MAEQKSLSPAEFQILLALVDGPKHGRGIKLDVRERTDGGVDMGPGTLYGAIKRLLRRGWISEVTESTTGACARSFGVVARMRPIDRISPSTGANIDSAVCSA